MLVDGTMAMPLCELLFCGLGPPELRAEHGMPDMTSLSLSEGPPNGDSSLASALLLSGSLSLKTAVACLVASTFGSFGMYGITPGKGLASLRLVCSICSVCRKRSLMSTSSLESEMLESLSEMSDESSRSFGHKSKAGLFGGSVGCGESDGGNFISSRSRCGERTSTVYARGVILRPCELSERDRTFPLFPLVIERRSGGTPTAGATVEAVRSALVEVVAVCSEEVEASVPPAEEIHSKSPTSCRGCH